MNDRGSKTERLGPDEVGIARAAELLARGALVAFPTETVYGLGADATSAAAIAGIYGRRRAHAQPAHRPRCGPRDGAA